MNYNDVILYISNLIEISFANFLQILSDRNCNKTIKEIAIGMTLPVVQGYQQSHSLFVSKEKRKIESFYH
jgi:hypothetical protein